MTFSFSVKLLATPRMRITGLEWCFVILLISLSAFCSYCRISAVFSTAHQTCNTHENNTNRIGKHQRFVLKHVRSRNVLTYGERERERERVSFRTKTFHRGYTVLTRIKRTMMCTSTGSAGSVTSQGKTNEIISQRFRLIIYGYNIIIFIDIYFE